MLTFFPSLQCLMVSSSSAVHESILNLVMGGLSCTLENIPVPPNIMYCQVAPNSGYESKSICTIPDLMIKLWSCDDQDHHHDSQTICLFESAFSQSNTDIMDKLQAYVDDKPDLLVIGKILIKQAIPYCRPGANQSIVRRLQWSQLMSKKEWAKDVETYSPVVVDKHTWFSLSSVEFHVWICKPGALKININSVDGDDYAFGVSIHLIYQGSNVDSNIIHSLYQMLYSNTKLDAVDSIFQHSLTFTKVIILELDIPGIGNLEDWSLPTHVVKLALYEYVLMNGVLDMAYGCYCTWHKSQNNPSHHSQTQWRGASSRVSILSNLFNCLLTMATLYRIQKRISVQVTTYPCTNI